MFCDLTTGIVVVQTNLPDHGMVKTDPSLLVEYRILDVLEHNNVCTGQHSFLHLP